MIVDSATGFVTPRRRRLGIVNEVRTHAELPPRAHALAEQIMARPRTVRRLTHGIASRPWPRRLVADLRNSYAHQLLGMAI